MAKHRNEPAEGCASSYPAQEPETLSCLRSPGGSCTFKQNSLVNSEFLADALPRDRAEEPFGDHGALGRTTVREAAGECLLGQRISHRLLPYLGYHLRGGWVAFDDEEPVHETPAPDFPCGILLQGRDEPGRAGARRERTGFRWSGIRFDCFALVEAAGVEPASESASPKESTCVSAPVGSRPA